MHILIYTDMLSADTYLNIQNRDDLFDTLSHRKKVLALAAHTHFLEHVDLRNAGWSGVNNSAGGRPVTLPLFAVATLYLLIPAVMYITRQAAPAYLG